MDYSHESVNFLDTMIFIKDGCIHSSIFRKSTDKLNLLRYSSFHPSHIRDSIPYSQALRYHRNCTDPDDRDSHLNELRQALKRNGYNANLINRQFRRAIQKDRNDLLARVNGRTSSDRTPLIVTYHPHLNKLRNITRDLQHIFDEDPILSCIFPEPPILAFRQPPNLKNMLVRSRLSFVGEDDLRGSIQPCGHARCKTCPIICRDVSIKRNNVNFDIRGNYDCKSSNVVYLIRCKHGCSSAWYIGETKTALTTRMNGHRSSIHHPKAHLPVGLHFSKEGHSENDMMLSVLAGNLVDTKKRKILEMKLIYKFKTHQTGLNRDLGFMAHYTMSR